MQLSAGLKLSIVLRTLLGILSRMSVGVFQWNSFPSENINSFKQKCSEKHFAFNSTHESKPGLS